jgi:hypothetical protein
MDAISTGQVAFLYSCVRACKPRRGVELGTSIGIFLALLVAALGCSSGASMPKTQTNQAPVNGPGGGSAGSGAPSAPSPSAGTGSGQAPATSNDAADRAAIASGSGGAGQAAAPSAAGSAPMSSPPDPKKTFDWEQTQPGKGDCQPGTYSGTFMCDAVVPGIVDPGSATLYGPIAFTLTKSQSGEFLEITNGRLEAVAVVWDIQAGITGKLDCGTNKLDAMTVDGVYGFGDANAATEGTVEGMMSGTLDRASSTLSGMWNINWDQTGVGGGTCNGPFTATLMP